MGRLIHLANSRSAALPLWSKSIQHVLYSLLAIGSDGGSARDVGEDAPRPGGDVTYVVAASATETAAIRGIVSPSFSPFWPFL